MIDLKQTNDLPAITQVIDGWSLTTLVMIPNDWSRVIQYITTGHMMILIDLIGIYHMTQHNPP